MRSDTPDLPVETRRRLQILRILASTGGSSDERSLRYGLNATGMPSNASEITHSLNWLSAHGLVRMTVVGLGLYDESRRRVTLLDRGRLVERGASIAGALADEPEFQIHEDRPEVDEDAAPITAEVVATAPSATAILDAAQHVCAARRRPAAGALLRVARDITAGRADDLTRDQLAGLFQDAADAIRDAIPVTTRIGEASRG